MRPSRSFLIIVIIFFCAITASAQKPLTKPEKPTQTSPALKSSSGAMNKSSDKSTKGYINGHEWVDLGLSVKWATCNVGTSYPTNYGNYYAWGETKKKLSYEKGSSITCGKNMGNIAGNPTYDVARANWGGTWRLPTASEIEELINKCNLEWTTQGGHNGYKITGPNGNSIFLPAAGWRYGMSLSGEEEGGNYWSATPNENDTDKAYDLFFNVDYFLKDWPDRSNGRSVRPVTE